MVAPKNQVGVCYNTLDFGRSSSGRTAPALQAQQRDAGRRQLHGGKAVGANLLYRLDGGFECDLDAIDGGWAMAAVSLPSARSPRKRRRRQLRPTPEIASLGERASTPFGRMLADRVSGWELSRSEIAGIPYFKIERHRQGREMGLRSQHRRSRSRPVTQTPRPADARPWARPGPSVARPPRPG